MTEPVLQHGTLLAIGDKGVLLKGPSGSGKSDLALRTIMNVVPAHFNLSQPILVADDQVKIILNENLIWGEAPENLKGLIEVRHLGIQKVPFQTVTRINLVVELSNLSQIERLPQFNNTIELIKGPPLPLIALDPFEHSAINKLLLAAQTIAQ